MQTENIPLNFVPPRPKKIDAEKSAHGTGRWSTDAVLDLIEADLIGHGDAASVCIKGALRVEIHVVFPVKPVPLIRDV